MDDVLLLPLLDVSSYERMGQLGLKQEELEEKYANKTRRVGRKIC